MHCHWDSFAACSTFQYRRCSPHVLCQSITPCCWQTPTQLTTTQWSISTNPCGRQKKIICWWNCCWETLPSWLWCYKVVSDKVHELCYSRMESGNEYERHCCAGAMNGAHEGVPEHL